MKHPSNFPIAHAAVLALILGVFLVDGCVNRTDRFSTLTAPDVQPGPTSKPLDIQRKVPPARGA
ncbi:hypothetical protein [Variovorax sp. ZT5R36]|uniref:hypothetical protein n=1 Tax=Variovorax sp. ZT5R36 TaxID=3443734 RepID=UPI003F495003